MLRWLRKQRLNEDAQRRLTIALARAEDELTETHVHNIAAIYRSVGDALSLRAVVEIYVDEMDVPDTRAEIVGRRVLAQLESSDAPDGVGPRRRPR